MTSPAVITPGWPGRLEAGLTRLVGRPSFWAVLTATLFAWPIAWSLSARLPPPPPVLATVPSFRLVDQAGRPFGSADLEGRVWVASFVFTRCQTTCPALTRVVTRVQDRTRALEPAFHLVTFSVDPGYDTPERLAAYARGAHASPRMWTFLTGPSDQVRAAVERGLRVGFGGADSDGAALAGSFHGTSLVLVDGRGRVRGYYDPEAPDAVERVVRDVGLLVNREGGGRT
jgi:protein SCO1/2